MSTNIVTTEDRTVAILAYLTLLGFIVAAILNSSNKTTLGAYHLRQALGLLLSGIALAVIAIVPILGWLAAWAGSIFLLVLWVLGLIAAINGQKTPVPVMGTHYEKWFGTAFN